MWSVLLSNLPTLCLYFLGSSILYPLSPIFTILYLVYCMFAIIWFWARICPYCHYYDTQGCPCGYGVIAAKFFKPRKGKAFNTVFKRNIVILFPSWFIPPIIGIYLLIRQYSLSLLLALILFSIVGFVIIPLISKLIACKDCDIKDECPWMN